MSFAAGGRHLKEGVPTLRHVKEGPYGYKLSGSDDEGDVGRDGVSGSERNLPEASCRLRGARNNEGDRF